MLRTPDRSLAGSVGQGGRPSESPGARPKTAVWREVHDKVLSERGLCGSAADRIVPEPVAGPPADAVFGMLDRNHDGVITRAEWNQAMYGSQVSYAVGTRPGPTRSSSIPRTVGAAQPPATTTPPTTGVGETRGGAARAQLQAEKQADLLGIRRNLAAQTAKLQALALDDGSGFANGAAPLLSPDRPTARGGRPQASMQELRKGVAAQRQEQDLQTALVQDSAKEAETTRGPLSGLAADRERLQRQVQEMRGQVADTRSELVTQHEQQKLQTAELRATMLDLQQEAARLQSEQRRQAKLLGDFQNKKGQPEVPSALVKQVDGVKDVVASQEHKIARIEESLHQTTAAQRSQLQDALQQGRQLSAALEEEAQRRAQSVAELQQLILQERQGGSGGRLQAELSKATSTMQAQTRDWVELAKIIRTEVSSLAHELRADRDARALEASSQRHEFTKMLEETRLANVAASVGGGFVADGDLGTDMLSRAGAIAVHKMVDTTKALLHGLEEALILRAGFIASMFHTWRAETKLQKVARRFEEDYLGTQEEWTGRLDSYRRSFEEELRKAADHHLSHKDVVKQRVALLIDKWANGEEVGLKRQCLRTWDRYASHERSLKRSAQSIHKACLEWIEGQTKALVHMVWNDWKHLTIAGVHQRNIDRALQDQEGAHQDALGRVLSEAEAKIAEGMARLEQRHKTAKQDLEVIIAKWERGSAKGLLTVTLQAWWQHYKAWKQGRRNSASTQQVVNKFLLGENLGILRSCAVAWSTQAKHEKELHAERRKLDDWLDGNRAQREADERALRDAAKAKLEEAHNAVMMVCRKWELGDKRGLQKDVWEVWSKYSKEKRKADRRRKAVYMQVDKWLEGEKRGRMHTTFLNWKNIAQQEAIVRKQENMFQKEQSQREKELERQKNGVMMVIRKWELGDARGTKKEVMEVWTRHIGDKIKASKRRHGIELQMDKWMEGEKKGLLHFCFLSWKSSAKEEAAARKHKELANSDKRSLEGMLADQQRRHMTELEMHKNEAARRHAEMQAVMQYTMAKWQLGGDKGLLESVLKSWRSTAAEIKRLARKRASVHDALLRSLEGETKAAIHLSFLNWKTLAKDEKRQREEQSRLQSERQHWEDREKAFMTAAQGKRDVQAELRAKAHAMSELMLKRWAGGDTQGLISTVFADWRRLTELRKAGSKKRQAITDSINRFLLGERLGILTTVYRAWHTFVLHELHHREMMDKLDQHGTYAEQLEARATALEEQLIMAYRQIDHITDTLQKELQTKEELAMELREAYGKSRMAAFGTTPTTHAGPMSSRPSSAQSRSFSTSRLEARRTSSAAPVPEALFDVLDRNQDGVISRGEWNRAMLSAEAASPPSGQGLLAYGGLSSIRHDSLLGSASSSRAPPSSSRPVSPRCDWDEVVRRMKAERMLGVQQDLP